MASHHQPRVVKLHRGVAPIDERRIARAMNDPDAILRRLDGVPSHVEIRPVSLLERIADAMESERALFAYLGFVGGCFVTVALAYVWARIGL